MSPIFNGPDSLKGGLFTGKGLMAHRGKRRVNKSDTDDVAVRIYQIQQNGKTFRAFIWSMFGIAVSWMFSDAWVRISGEPDPPWLRITMVAAGGVGSGLIPGLVAWWKFRCYMKSDHQRLIEFEKREDPTREGSGLTKTGDDPNV